VYKNSSNVPAGSSNMTFNGTTLTVAALTESSALKYKTDIVELTGVLEKLIKLRGVYFTNKKEGSRQIGFIADEVNKEFPELVQFKDGEVESLHYPRITAILVQAIKELVFRIEKLEENG
jgi:hypothetical protein